MKNGIKTLAMWLIIGVIFIVVLSSILENNNSKLKYSELITNINEGKVESVQLEADGKSATVELKDTKTKKEVNIPDVETFMRTTEEYLKDGTFALEEKSESLFVTIIGLLTPFGLLIIFFIFWFIMMSGPAGGSNGNKNGILGYLRQRKTKNRQENGQKRLAHGSG